MASTLQVTSPPTGKVCPAELEIDVSWDWTDRSPSSVYLVGRMYPRRGSCCAHRRRRSSPPASTDHGWGRPAGHADVQRRRRDAERRPGARSTTSQPTAVEVFDPADWCTWIRRYRLRIPKLTADFGATPTSGLPSGCHGMSGSRHSTRQPGGTRTGVRLRPRRPTGPAGDRAPGQPARRRRPQPCPVGWPRGLVRRLRVYRYGRHHDARLLGRPDPGGVGDCPTGPTCCSTNREANPDRRPFTRLTPARWPQAQRAWMSAWPGVDSHPRLRRHLDQPWTGPEGPWPHVGPGIRTGHPAGGARIAVPAPPGRSPRGLETTGTVIVDDHPSWPSRRPARPLPGSRRRRRPEPRHHGPTGRHDPPPAAGWTVTDSGDGLVRITGADTPGPSWKRVGTGPSHGDDDRSSTRLPSRTASRSGARFPVGSLPSNAIAVVVPPAGPPTLGPSSPPGRRGIADVQFDWTRPRHVASRHSGGIGSTSPSAHVGSAPPPEYTGPLDGVPLTPPTGDGSGAPTPEAPRHSTRDRPSHLDRRRTRCQSVQLADPLGRVSSAASPRARRRPLLPAPDPADLEVVRFPAEWCCRSRRSGSPIARFSGKIGLLLRISAQPRARRPALPAVPADPADRHPAQTAAVRFGRHLGIAGGVGGATNRSHRCDARSRRSQRPS